MKDFLKVKKGYLWVFLTTQLVLYILMIIFEFGSINHDGLIKVEYSIIILNLVFVLFSFFFIYKKKESILENSFLLIALFFTLISDYFLLILNNYYEIGLSTFIVAQLAHYIRFILVKKRRSRVYLLSSFLIRIFVPTLIIIIAKLTDPLYILVCYYGTQLIMNFVEHIVCIFDKKEEKKLKHILIASGFLLFILCDLSVGLYNIGNDVLASYIWVFYVPSQVLITTSLLIFDIYEKRSN